VYGINYTEVEIEMEIFDHKATYTMVVSEGLCSRFPERY